MPNFDDGVSEAGSSAPPVTARRPGGRISCSWDFLAVLLLMVGSLPLAWIAPHTLVPIPHPGTFDDHWVLDATFKVTHHIYFARDVVFLYGPLAHWLMAAPPRLAGFSLGHIYTSFRTLLLWCALLFTYFAVRLLIPEQPAWKRFVLVLLLGVFWTSWDGRTALGILLFVLFLRGWYAVREQRWNPLPFACGSALLAAGAFWYSADTGVYSVAAWLLAMAGVACEGRREKSTYRSYIVAAASFAAGLVGLVFVVNIVTGGLVDFHFWRTSLALVSVHRWNEAAGMSQTGAVHLLAPLVIGSVLFVLRLLIPADSTQVLTARRGFLLSAFVFALLSMQSGLVRSDYNHIVAGVYPMVLFAGGILFSFASRTGSVLAVLAATAASASLAEPPAIFQPANIRTRLRLARHPLMSCPGGYFQFEDVCFPTEFALPLDNAVIYLQQHSSERDNVLIFPYQYMFAVAARRDVSGGVEQTFLANGNYLSQFHIDGWERSQPPVGLYFRDASDGERMSFTLSQPIDEVSNFTRTPEVWLWAFRHYRADQAIAPGVIGLLRDESRQARITMQEQSIGLATRTYRVDSANSTIDLGAPTWPRGGADFLRLRLKVRYSPLWKLRKPERLQLEITCADGSRSVRTFVAEPNVATGLWFYPWNEADLLHYFDADESRWRSPNTPAVTHLRLLISPLDWFSQKPESITIDSADAVRFTMSR